MIRWFTRWWWWFIFQGRVGETRCVGGGWREVRCGRFLIFFFCRWFFFVTKVTSVKTYARSPAGRASPETRWGLADRCRRWPVGDAPQVSFRDALYGDAGRRGAAGRGRRRDHLLFVLMMWLMVVFFWLDVCLVFFRVTILVDFVLFFGTIRSVTERNKQTDMRNQASVINLVNKWV